MVQQIREVPRQLIEDVCVRNRIRKLSVFGSALRDDLRPDSDLDLLVEFQPGSVPGLAFFAIQDELSKLFGRTVDLNTPNSFRPEVRKRVVAEAEALYDLS